MIEDLQRSEKIPPLVRMSGPNPFIMSLLLTLCESQGDILPLLAWQTFLGRIETGSNHEMMNPLAGFSRFM